MRCTGPFGCRITIQAECQMGLRAILASLNFFDSGSHFQANTTLQTQREAARIPGAVWPQREAKDPITGPNIVPRFVAAEIHPSDRARSPAGTVSAMYACVTPVVPPPAPCTNRERNNSQTEFANPKTV